MSLLRLHTGTTIGLSLVSRYKPISVSAASTAFRASNLEIKIFIRAREKYLDHFLLLPPLHPRELSAVVRHVPVVGEDVDEGEVVPLAALVVVGVMRGRDLDGARAEVLLHECVGHDGQLPVCE